MLDIFIGSMVRFEFRFSRFTISNIQHGNDNFADFNLLGMFSVGGTCRFRWRNASGDGIFHFLVLPHKKQAKVGAAGANMWLLELQ